MTTEPAPPAPPPSWPELALTERRVLGVLVEKAKTTTDAYPLSVNALVTGCNQKSNRDPVLSLSEMDVERALDDLLRKGLVGKVTGGRVERWKHVLYEAWKVDKVELAVLAELLLRGAQTEGELRARAARMEPIDGLDALRDVLGRLAGRQLVVYLTPPGRRGTTLTHGFHAAAELERLQARAGAALADEEAAPAPSRPTAPALEAQLAEVRAEVAELRDRLAALAAEVEALRACPEPGQAAPPIH